jgi:DNA-binding transcriptional LysR family regulator
MVFDIGWDLYRSFLGVLREGSLSGAARVLGITQPTVGRHIAALEKALDVALFIRTQQGLVPTETALSLRTYAEAMESTAASMERAASGQGEGVRGVVRISTSEVVGVEVLPPLVTRLREQHPDLKVELVLTNQVQDLLRLEADIAVRQVRPRQEQLIARSIGRIDLGLYAHQDYLRRRGTPRRIADFAGHSIIGYDRPSDLVRNAGESLKGFTRDVFSLRTDNDLAQLALIRCGAGIGVCQAPLAKRNAALVRLLPRSFALPLETWVTMHEDLRNVPRCRAAFDALVDGLQQYAAD